MKPPQCNCELMASCLHPWGSNKTDKRGSQDNVHIATSVKVEGKAKNEVYQPIPDPPTLLDLDYLLLMAFGHQMPNVGIEEDMPLDMMASAAISGACKTKHFGPKLSAYDLDPLSIAQCKESKNWTNRTQGNSWYESIMTEVQNLLRFKVYTVVDKTTADGHNIFPTLNNFLTKRTKDSTPQIEVIDKRKTRIVSGGHRCVAGRDFCRLDAYAPVPIWRQVKLQLAMAAIHGLKLKAFDCTAAYLQTPIEKELYVRPPKGLMELLGEDKDSVWKLDKALYGYPVTSSLWY